MTTTASTLSDPEVAAMLAASAKLVDTWPLFLDALDGMIAQTVAHGFTHDQARGIVHAIIAGPAGSSR